MSLSETKHIRLALLDDHPLVRSSYELVMGKEPDMLIVGSFGRSRDLMNFLRNDTADILLLDYILDVNELDGLSLIKQLRLRYPDLKILLSSSVESLAVIRTAFMLGIRGYVGKREDASVYFQAIRSVAGGQRYIPQEIANNMAQVPTRKRDENLLDDIENTKGEAPPLAELSKLLTPREAEILRCFLDGMEIPEIAAKLKRSRKTISGHKQTGMKKLGLSSDLELFKFREDLFR